MNKTELLALLKNRGFSAQIVSAFEKVKREEFIPEHTMLYAYDDIAIPLEPGTTISQPSTIAFMLTLLNPQDKQKVLEIGSGTGYVLALLSELCPNSEMYGIEINKRFAVVSRKRLASKKNIHIIHRSGANGLPEKTPYDRILVSAAFSSMPYKLLSQLTDNGILVAPVQDKIVCIEKSGATYKETSYQGFAFVPLIEE